MVPCEVPEVTLDQLDLVPRPQNHALPASCQEVPEPGMQAAVNTITFQLQQEPLRGGTLSNAWPGQGKPRQLGETNYVIYPSHSTMITVVLWWIFLSESRIGSYLSDQFLAKTYATYQKQFFRQFYKQ